MKRLKVLVFVLCLSLVGNSAHASDWSWLTGGIRGFFAPILRHSGKVLVGLGATVAVTGGGYSLFAGLRSYFKKRAHEQLGKDLDRVTEQWEKGEQKRKALMDERYKEITDKCGEIAQGKNVASIEELKKEAEVIDKKYVCLGGLSRQSYIDNQFNYGLRCLGDAIAKQFEEVTDVKKFDELEVEYKRIDGLVNKEFVPVITMLNGLQYRVGGALARLLDRDVKNTENLSEVGLSVSEQVSRMWGADYKEKCALVERLEKYDKKEALAQYRKLFDARYDPFCKILSHVSQENSKPKSFDIKEMLVNFLIGRLKPWTDCKSLVELEIKPFQTLHDALKKKISALEHESYCLTDQ